jgi:peptidoglycan hydrolase CwlO-like protein
MKKTKLVKTKESKEENDMELLVICSGCMRKLEIVKIAKLKRIGMSIVSVDSNHTCIQDNDSELEKKISRLENELKEAKKKIDELEGGLEDV